MGRLRVDTGLPRSLKATECSSGKGRGLWARGVLSRPHRATKDHKGPMLVGCSPGAAQGQGGDTGHPCTLHTMSLCTKSP